MGVKGIGEGGLSYIYRKVGEAVSGVPCRDEIVTAATVHGNTYELDAIRMFAAKQNTAFPILQKMVVDADSGFGTTPDAIWIVNESEDGTAYNAKTIEAKCPYSFDAYIRLWKCKTPEDVKKEEPKYFWQILDQLLVCDCLVGYLVVYQPFFKFGQLNIVEFRKINLIPDFKLLGERKKLAVEIFNDTRNQLMQ